MKLAMVFPGQGSQAVGMVRGYAGLPHVEETLAEAANVLGADFVQLLEEGPAEKLNLTVNTQPAMVTAGAAAFRACGARRPMTEMVAGQSWASPGAWWPRARSRSGMPAMGASAAVDAGSGARGQGAMAAI